MAEAKPKHTLASKEEVAKLESFKATRRQMQKHMEDLDQQEQEFWQGFFKAHDIGPGYHVNVNHDTREITMKPVNKEPRLEIPGKRRRP